MAAALTHNVSPTQLREVSRAIPKVLVLVGEEDHLVRVSNSFYIKEHMPEAEFVQWEKTGHGIPAQHKKRFNALLERIFSDARAAIRKGPSE
jgi:pimeloyl-ACP methyl ester carboxylesterase